MKKTLIVILSILAVIIIAGACWFIPVYLEMNAAIKVFHAETPDQMVEACNHYLAKYSGRRNEYDVLLYTATNTPHPEAFINLCIEKYPQGKFNDVLEQYRNYLQENPDASYQDFENLYRKDE